VLGLILLRKNLSLHAIEDIKILIK